MTNVKVCEACGKIFYPHRSDAKTCSPKCRMVLVRRRARERKLAALHTLTDHEQSMWLLACECCPDHCEQLGLFIYGLPRGKWTDTLNLIVDLLTEARVRISA